jgi:hypothetical protein
LDEAHDEYLLKQAAADVASSNVKRRKIVFSTGIKFLNIANHV